jgi:DNA-binding HxlR family transcriptional regulator
MNDAGSRPKMLIQLLASRWTPPILAQLSNTGQRYQYDSLDGIAYKVLTETLRRAERDGLIARHLDPGRIGVATLYELTDLGSSLDAPLAAMAEWGDANRPATPGRPGHLSVGASPSL